MAKVTNTGFYPLHWNQLVNSETGRTLELAPGESAECDLPVGFQDQWLKTDDEMGDYVPPAPSEETPAPAPPVAPTGTAFPTMTTDTSAPDA